MATAKELANDAMMVCTKVRSGTHSCCTVHCNASTWTHRSIGTYDLEAAGLTTTHSCKQRWANCWPVVCL